MHAIALVVVHLRDGRVDGYLVKVGPAETGDLRVHVGVDSSGEQRIVGEVDAGDDMGCAEGDLFGLGKEVVWIAIQYESPDGLHRNELLRNELGGVQHVERELLRLLLGEHLNAKLPLRVVACLDGFPEIASVEVGIGAGNLHGFVPRQRMRAGLRVPVELHEARFPGFVHEAEGMHAESLHHAKAARYRAVRHYPEQHVRRFGHQRHEVPESVVRRRCLRHRVMRLRLDRVDYIRELHRILNEEHGNVVTYEVPVALVGVELDRKSAHITCSVGRSALTGDRGEADEHRRALAGLREEGCACQLRQGAVHSKYPCAPEPRACTTRSGMRS